MDVDEAAYQFVLNPIDNELPVEMTRPPDDLLAFRRERGRDPLVYPIRPEIEEE